MRARGASTARRGQPRHTTVSRSRSANAFFTTNVALSARGKPQYTAACSIASGDLGLRAADVERRVHVHVELWLAPAEGGQDAEGDELPITRLRPGARVDLGEGPRDDLVREFRGHVSQCLDDFRAGLSVDGIRHLSAAPGLLLSGWVSVTAPASLRLVPRRLGDRRCSCRRGRVRARGARRMLTVGSIVIRVHDLCRPTRTM